MKRNQRHIAPLLIVIFLAIINACSTQKNTSASRWWHSFNARYNTYYNGSLAYIDGSLEKETGNKDNFTEMIPLYTVGNKNSKELGKGNFEKAIQKSEKAIHQHSIKRRPIWDKNRRKTAKDIEWLQRREYNPFLWKAWMLMGRSQFHMGSFDEAASTFSYMSRLYATQPAIFGKARAWLAKAYIEEGWLYDAEDVIRNMRRDSMDWRAVKEWDYTYTDYYLHTGEFKKAIPYLKKVIKHEMRRKQKAREWYLMGQIYASLGQRDSAYKAFKHVVRLNSSYELEFNARIAQTEVMAKGQAKKMVTKLRHMAASDNNKDYLDQVYYAIGNIYLAEKDTMRAIYAYEEGNKKATRSGIEKGVLLLHLGDLYWAKEKFGDARRCYGVAIGLLDKDRKDYQQMSERSKVLDELVPYTDAVELQDSLQTLAKMNEKDRNAAIDRVIDALKKKEKEEAKAQAEANAQQVQAQNGGMANGNFNANTTNKMNSNQQNGLWYFYNPMTVSQGKATFQKLWGKRENVDNWQRINKTVVANLGGAEGMTDAQRDSLAREAAKQDSLANLTDSAQNNPHKREYYLAQIPFTPEQLQASNGILEDGLFHSGVIFKDKLDNLRLSERNLRRLADQYTDYEHMDDVYYHLFLLYSRLNMPSLADAYLQKLKGSYPKSQWTVILSDPYFKENARMGTHMEDSLYTATYAAFKADRLNEVLGNARISETRFPTGANRDKFIFIGGLSKLNGGDSKGCLDDMKTIVEKYPESGLSEMAGMIVNGVNAGKRLHGGKFDIGNVWSRRSEVLNDSDSIATRRFSNERNANFLFMIVYKPDSVNENQLLFELARYNFTNFLVRNFEIAIEDANGLHQMKITGFRNYDEALQYARQLYQQRGIVSKLGNSRSIIISEQNFELLGNPFSYDDYDKFYIKHFAPLKVSTFHLLTEPAEVTTEKPKEPTPEEIDKALDNGTFIDNGLDVEPINAGTNVTPETKEEQKAPTGTTIIPAEPANTAVPTGTTIIPAETETQKATEKVGTDIPMEKAEKQPEKTTYPIKEKTVPSTKTAPAAKTTVPKVASKPTTTPAKQPIPAKKPAAPVKKTTSTGIYFNDGFGLEKSDTTKNTKNKPTDKKKETKKQKSFDLEDEYYDLEGF
jgi:tetratricopeptide (TPR) repeat protein